MIKLLKRYLYSYKSKLIFTFLFSLLQVTLQLLLPQFTDRILKVGVVDHDIAFILRTGRLMLLLTLAVAGCMIGASYFSGYVAGSFSYRCRKEMFHKVCYFSEEQTNMLGSSTLTNRFSNDVTYTAFAMMMGLRTALTTPLLGIGAVIVAMSINWKLTLILLAGLILCVFMILRSQKHTAPLFDTSLSALDHMNLLFKEKLTGVRTIRAFNRQEYEEKRLENGIGDTWLKDLAANNAVSGMITRILLVMNMIVVIIFFVSSFSVRRGMMQAADLVKFIQYVVNLISSITAISTIIQALPRIQLTSGRILEVLSRDTSALENRKDDSEPDSSVKGEIVFEKVSFGYPGADREVLKDISFRIHSGERVAFLGTTGSGKSTLLSVMMGFNTGYTGSVMVNGCEVSGMSAQTMSKLISFAPQKSMVLNKSIYDNLAVAKPGVSYPLAEKALEAACALEFVRSKEEGLDFVLEQRGMNVSGGQRQRLSLARALLKDAGIYVFDDSFSALDPKTEKTARNSIFSLLSGKTVIIVAQRIRTIMDADRIYLMDEGRIVDQGTHEELLKTSSLYGHIYKTQFLKEGAA